ncbi:pyrimidine utilization regulatory protein R [Alteromonas sp. KUL42]|uniref:HTH-type transcriptional regulator RutR n=1 Tax=Alteromonas sp. KUL42 TaxID=2480797 RepID=UPI001036AFA3|nr:HTH-type transcriptional regulator RutR [Alteromonas sp. KUL42]TAP33500.1 HTH-type transcriptional regulator RutR [Alteromonas sp. KUL42]GEA08366.1 pyrimidine utilization regulatory protein R [Alteromonas sp. KUL42]
MSDKELHLKTGRSFSPTTQKRRAEALQAKRSRIMQAALSLFAKNGVSGTSVEQISELADVSKSNLLYYFKSKEQLYLDVITHLLDVWLTPLQSFSAEQDPIETLSEYIKVKLEMSRDNPAESKLFCMEVVQGAPLLIKELETPLKELLDAKSAVINAWIDAGKLKPVEPYHLIFSIWAITQHYADFSVQIKAVTGKDLSNAAFFNSTLDNIKRILLDGLKP